MEAQSFLRGTVALVAAGVMAKALGALFSIPLARLIGAEGVGLLHMAAPVFATALVVCVSGVPVATSKLVSERLASGDVVGARRVAFAALAVVVPVGAAFSVCIHRGAGFVATFVLNDARALLPLKALAPAVAFASASGVLRGYFQGRRTMTPTAASQVLEQAVRVTVGLGAAYALLPRGLQWAAAGSAAGTCAGAVASLAFLGACFVAVGRRERARSLRAPGSLRTREILGRLFGLAGPATLGALVGPAFDAINAVIVPARLQSAGFSTARCTELYGRFSVMALGLVALPGVAAGAIATSIVPQVAAANASGQSRRVSALAAQAVRGAFVIGVPCSVGLAVLPGQICAMLFNDPGGGVPLGAMAFGSFFLCLMLTTAGVLNGLGRAGIPARNSLAGGLVAAGVILVLTGVPGINVRGAALGTALGFAVAGTANALAVARLCRGGAHILTAGWKALVASAAIAPAAIATYDAVLGRTYSNGISTLAGIAAGAAAYGLGLIGLGELTPRELELIPFVGRGLARLVYGSGPPPR